MNVEIQIFSQTAMLVQFFIPDLFLCLSNINLCDFCGGKENGFTFNIKIKLCSIKLELKFNLVRFLYIIFLYFFYLLSSSPFKFLAAVCQFTSYKILLKAELFFQYFPPKETSPQKNSIQRNLFKTWSDVTAKAF